MSPLAQSPSWPAESRPARRGLESAGRRTAQRARPYLGDRTVVDCPANWKTAATFKHCAHNTLGGLTPGQMVSVRLCGIGAT